jgi:phosphopantothenoylcysteine decarboxylase/phosphopantothenate--cysteine ligase
VTLISGPTHLAVPKGVVHIPVVSARDMERAVVRYFKKAHALFMTSAVCDFKPISSHHHKIKRSGNMVVTCRATKDILMHVARIKQEHQLVCGFCIETRDLYSSAKKKLNAKKLDLIVGCLSRKKIQPFGGVRISPLVLDKNGRVSQVKNKTKKYVAQWLLKYLFPE